MNYRHAFHAGNLADVLKHAAIALILEHLKQKAAAFRVVDTHAGAGRYDLAGTTAARTAEWRDGIGRLFGPDAPSLPDAVAAVLEPYLSAIRAHNTPGKLEYYPGSPCLVQSLMRPVDRLIANELHPDDALLLRAAIGRDHRCKVTTVDAWHALRSLLPPKERRGLVIIDPPFEEAGEFDRLARGLFGAHRRFATGTYLVWFPIKDVAAYRKFRGVLTAGSIDKLLLAELHVRVLGSSERLSATGIAIGNPPFRLHEQLGQLLPFLAHRLAQGPGAMFELAWLRGGP